MNLVQGRNVSQIFNDLKIACDMLSVFSEVMIMAEPQNREKSVHVNLLNHKLGQLQSNNDMKFIKIPARRLRHTM